MIMNLQKRACQVLDVIVCPFHAIHDKRYPSIEEHDEFDPKHVEMCISSQKRGKNFLA